MIFLDCIVVHETADNKAVALIDLLKNPPENMSPEDRWFLDGTVVQETVDNKAVALIDSSRILQTTWVPRTGDF